MTPAHIYNMIAHDMYMARTYHIAIPDNLDERVVEAVERDPSIDYQMEKFGGPKRGDPK